MLLSPLKVDTYTLTSEGVALKKPTYYLTKGNEELEKFEKVDLYSNKTATISIVIYKRATIYGKVDRF